MTISPMISELAMLIANCSWGAIDKGLYKVHRLTSFWWGHPSFIAGVCLPAATLKGYPFFPQHTPSLGGVSSERSNIPTVLNRDPLIKGSLSPRTTILGETESAGNARSCVEHVSNPSQSEELSLVGERGSFGFSEESCCITGSALD